MLVGLPNPQPTKSPLEYSNSPVDGSCFLIESEKRAPEMCLGLQTEKTGLARAIGSSRRDPGPEPPEHIVPPLARYVDAQKTL